MKDILTGHVGISVVQERLNRILGFVLYGMAVYLDMKPSVQAASTCLCCEIIIHPLPSAISSYCLLYCCSIDTIHPLHRYYFIGLVFAFYHLQFVCGRAWWLKTA